MQDPLARGQISPLETFNLFRAAVDFADYFVRSLDEYEKDQRYDDNQAKMLINALRMYEKGDLSKKDLKKIIDLLPDSVPTKAVEVRQTHTEGNDQELAKLLKRLTE